MLEQQQDHRQRKQTGSEGGVSVFISLFRRGNNIGLLSIRELFKMAIHITNLPKLCYILPSSILDLVKLNRFNSGSPGPHFQAKTYMSDGGKGEKKEAETQKKEKDFKILMIKERNTVAIFCNTASIVFFFILVLPLWQFVVLVTKPSHSAADVTDKYFITKAQTTKLQFAI